MDSLTHFHYRNVYIYIHYSNSLKVTALDMFQKIWFHTPLEGWHRPNYSEGHPFWSSSTTLNLLTPTVQSLSMSFEVCFEYFTPSVSFVLYWLINAFDPNTTKDDHAR